MEGGEMRGDEWGGENNTVCLRFSAISRLRVAQRFVVASANLVSARSQGPVTVRPHTHTDTHTLRERLPWEPTPLWLFPSRENNRHQSLSTSLSFIVSFSLSFLFLVAISSRPLFITGAGSLSLFLLLLFSSMSSCFPPLLPSLTVVEFGLLCIIYPRWDLYSSHKWEAKHYLDPTCTNTTLRVSKLQPQKYGERGIVCLFGESRREKCLDKNRKFFSCPLCYFSLKHGGVWRDFPWVTHCFLWTCSRQVIFY